MGYEGVMSPGNVGVADTGPVERIEVMDPCIDCGSDTDPCDCSTTQQDCKHDGGIVSRGPVAPWRCMICHAILDHLPIVASIDSLVARMRTVAARLDEGDAPDCSQEESAWMKRNLRSLADALEAHIRG